MSESMQPTSVEMAEPGPARPEPMDRGQEALRIASQKYEAGLDWATFFGAILGSEGIVRQMFPSAQEMAAFEQTEAYAEIQKMVAKLRERSKHPKEASEPTRVITVRLPRSLHDALKTEAHERKTSMNQLCISKLLQLIDDQLVPSD
jgi:predicted HicB family RNase H-like nuclease